MGGRKRGYQGLRKGDGDGRVAEKLIANIKDDTTQKNSKKKLKK